MRVIGVQLQCVSIGCKRIARPADHGQCIPQQAIVVRVTFVQHCCRLEHLDGFRKAALFNQEMAQIGVWCMLIGRHGDNAPQQLLGDNMPFIGTGDTGQHMQDPRIAGFTS